MKLGFSQGMIQFPKKLSYNIITNNRLDGANQFRENKIGFPSIKTLPNLSIFLYLKFARNYVEAVPFHKISTPEN